MGLRIVTQRVFDVGLEERRQHVFGAAVVDGMPSDGCCRPAAGDPLLMMVHPVTAAAAGQVYRLGAVRLPSVVDGNGLDRSAIA